MYTYILLRAAPRRTTPFFIPHADFPATPTAQTRERVPGLFHNPAARPAARLAPPPPRRHVRDQPAGARRGAHQHHVAGRPAPHGVRAYLNAHQQTSGYCSLLLKMIMSQGQVSADVQLAAAIQFKNGVRRWWTRQPSTTHGIEIVGSAAGPDADAESAKLYEIAPAERPRSGSTSSTRA